MSILKNEKMVTKSTVHCMYWDSLWSSFQGKLNLEEIFGTFQLSQFWYQLLNHLGTFEISHFLVFSNQPNIEGANKSSSDCE